MIKFCQFVDGTNRFVGKFVSWLCLLLILIVVVQVISRYVFQSSSIAVSELEWHLFAIIFLCSMGWTLEQEGHVRVDLLYGRYSYKVKAWVNIFGYCFMLIPLCFVLVWFGIDFTKGSMDYINPRPGDYYSADWFLEGSYFYKLFSTCETVLRDRIFFGELSSDPGGLEGRWLIKAVIPLSFILLSFQALSMLFKNIISLKTKKISDVP